MSGNPNWTPDGKIIYLEQIYKEGYSILPFTKIDYNICTIDPDGSDRQVITTFEKKSLSSISCDENKVVFDSWNYDTHSWDGICSIDINGGNFNVLNNEGRHPEISPDGTKIAYWEGEGDGIWIMDIDGKNKEELYDDWTAFTWSPDSSKLAISNDAGTEVVILDIVTKSTETISISIPEPSFTMIDWSPDGEKFAYQDDGFCVINIDGTGKIKIGEGEGKANWSPDGTKIAYGKVVVILANPDGTGYEVLLPATEDGEPLDAIYDADIPYWDVGM